MTRRIQCIKKRGCYQKKSHGEKLVEDVLVGCEKYRFPYRELKMRSRVRRVDEIAKNIISACVKKSELREKGYDYIQSDEELRSDVSMVLGELAVRLETELKCNFRLHKEVTPSPQEIESEKDDPPSGVDECGFFKESDFDGPKEKYKVAIKMLGELTMGGYKRVSDELKATFKIPKKWLPSFYILTKNRPKMDQVVIKPSLSTAINTDPKTCDVVTQNALTLQDLADVGLDVDDADIDATILGAESGIPIVGSANLGPTDFIGQDKSIEDCMEEMKASRATGEINGAKISGKYEDYVNILLKQYDDRGIEVGKNAIVLDSYDGAEHHKTDKKRTNVISYSSKIVSDNILREGVTAGQSLDILT